MNSLLDRFKAYIYLVAHFFKVFTQLVSGVWRLSKLTYAPVTIFGGTHLAENSDYLKKAATLARRLSAHKIPVLTGGGPGIMEAAMCAIEPSEDVITTMAVWVKGLTADGLNRCAKHSIIMDYYFARKLLLVNYSVGFVVFPGGFGTLDELLELLTLIQNNMRASAPIVLVGVSYWASFMDWITNSALKEGLITPDDVKMFSITDDIDEAFTIIHRTCKRIPFSVVASQPKPKKS